MALGLDLARPLIAGAAGSGAPVLDIAVTDPAQAPQAGTEPQMWSHACTPAAKWTSAKPGASGRTTACSCGPRATSNPQFSPPPSGAFYRHRLRCALFASPPPSAAFAVAASLWSPPC